MKVILSPRAEKQLKKISKVNQIVIVKKLKSLKGKSTISGAEKLKSFKDIFRIRVGDFRIVYKQRKKEIYVISIGHRSDIYKLISRLFK